MRAVGVRRGSATMRPSAAGFLLLEPLHDGRKRVGTVRANQNHFRARQCRRPGREAAINSKCTILCCRGSDIQNRPL